MNIIWGSHALLWGPIGLSRHNNGPTAYMVFGLYSYSRRFSSSVAPLPLYNHDHQSTTERPLTCVLYNYGSVGSRNACNQFVEDGRKGGPPYFSHCSFAVITDDTSFCGHVNAAYGVTVRDVIGKR